VAIRQHLHSGMRTRAASSCGTTVAHHVDKPVRRLVKHTAKHCQWQACDANVSDLTVPRQAMHEDKTSYKGVALPAAFNALRAGTEDSYASASAAQQAACCCSAPGSVSLTTCCNDPNSMSWHWMMSM